MPGVDVVQGVGVVVTVGVAVVVTAGVGVARFSSSDRTSATNASTFASRAAVSSKVKHGPSLFASSFSNQPFVGSVPPSNLPVALARQSVRTVPHLSGSFWHFSRHFSRPAAFLRTHFFFPAEQAFRITAG